MHLHVCIGLFVGFGCSVSATLHGNVASGKCGKAWSPSHVNYKDVNALVVGISTRKVCTGKICTPNIRPSDHPTFLFIQLPTSTLDCLVHPLQEDTIPHQAPPCSTSRNIEPNRIHTLNKYRRVYFVLHESPLATDAAASIQRRIIREDYIVQRAQHIAINVDVEGETLRVTRNGQTQQCG